MRKSLVFILLFLFLILTVSSIAFAEEKTSPELEACVEEMEATDKYHTLLPLFPCYNDEINRQRRRLEDAANKVLQKIPDPELKKALADSLQAWNTYSEGYSNFLGAAPNAGTLNGLYALEWLVLATAEMVDAVENIDLELYSTLD